MWRASLEALKSQQRKFLSEATADGRDLQRRSLLLALASLCLMLVIAGLSLVAVRRVGRELSTTIAKLSEGSAQVAGAASQVSAASQSLAQGSSEQASALEQTSAAVEQVLSLSRQNSDRSSDAAELVTASQEKFGRVNDSLNNALSAMDDISAKSDRISNIIRTIDEITFQTNILALNAAVEAARAGEAGMGFAVVADEVRRLAQRCAQAAKDTADLIEASIASAREGKSKVDLVAQLVRQVIGEAARVNSLVGDIHLGAREQAQALEQITRAISQLQQVTQQMAFSAEEGARGFPSSCTHSPKTSTPSLRGSSALVG